MKLLKKVVFLDRDGTINMDSADFIKSRSEFEFIPGSIEAIRNLTINGFTSIVITNQSALARNYVSQEELNAMHSLMCRSVASGGGKITDVFFCPHLPDEGCTCRKPASGLIDQARHKYHIDLADSKMVGDSANDIACGLNAGCGQTVLVESGLNPDVAKELKQKSISPDFVANDLREAAEWIIGKTTHP
jgi:D-glycero-D-manno-heptose 1,7-bisphosphate phosphatase